MSNTQETWNHCTQAGAHKIGCQIGPLECRKIWKPNDVRADVHSADNKRREKNRRRVRRVANCDGRRPEESERQVAENTDEKRGDNQRRRRARRSAIATCDQNVDERQDGRELKAVADAKSSRRPENRAHLNRDVERAAEAPLLWLMLDENGHLDPNRIGAHPGRRGKNADESENRHVYALEALRRRRRCQLERRWRRRRRLRDNIGA